MSSYYFVQKSAWHMQTQLSSSISNKQKQRNDTELFSCKCITHLLHHTNQHYMLCSIVSGNLSIWKQSVTASVSFVKVSVCGLGFAPQACFTTARQKAPYSLICRYVCCLKLGPFPHQHCSARDQVMPSTG